ncbi:MAG: alanine--tRNA ligase [Hyphomicrobiales bacterium]|nr:alanine--tRNA ligase [Hyphomicrobiales bacterium]
MTSVNTLREAFLQYFAGQQHAILPSAPLVPHNDPTLMFTNAGMVPFKNVFSGAESLQDKQGNPIRRATTSQKCVRAGGKHNDLDNVGYTARHHTFFEMLGNFSFADYFKEEAIYFAWEFLTKTLEISPEKLLVTVYHTDDEAFDLWKKISGFPDEKIRRIPTSDNFWAMGDTGPCGPCSEIFYDHGAEIPGGPPGSPDEDGDRFIEIWNLVFMQFEKHVDGNQTDLPRPCIDTGMGLERMAAVMQGVHDNYDIDLFRQLIAASQDISGNSDHRVSHRVIADHLRASCFLIADGVLPSNEGRAYVLRRIMRRAMRHAHQLGVKEPLLYRLVPTLIHEMGQAYPELIRAEALMTETLRLEEERFRETLERGLKLLEEAASPLNHGDRLPGETAFKLYDTYGFPLDLTQDILRARSISVDTDGFNQAMEAQKKRARAAWAGSGEQATDDVWFDIREKHGATEFLGYEQEHARGVVLALVHDKKPVEHVEAGQQIAIVTNQTPFYGESGGQMGDRGRIHTESAGIRVTDTKKLLGDLQVHIGTVQSGTVRVGEEVSLDVDHTRRTALRGNHSATHLLHAALRRQLGDHVTQKGSQVEAESFRFDFSHPKALEAEQLHAIEQEVNQLIRQNSAVTTRLMTPQEAIEQGAMALFGEKYGDEVRVLSMGTADNGGDYSVELCGGTHVQRTGDIGLFLITRESAVAAGVRRIEAVTGAGALRLLQQRESLLQDIADGLKVAPEEAAERIRALRDERRKLEQELSDARKKLAMGGGGGTSAGASNDAPEKVNGVQFVGKVLDGLPAKELKNIADTYKQQIGSGVVALIATESDKASIVVGVTADLTERLSAVDLVRVGSEALGGKGGGGRPDLAQAGGSTPENAPAALDAIKARL